MIHTLIVSQALIQHQDGVSLHPDLFAWQDSLAAYKQTWFECGDKNPLGWYAALCDQSASSLLMQACSSLPDDCQQCWVVSPFHAQLQQTRVRVYAEGLFPWSAEDADDLCATLNPLLMEEGMQLHAVGAGLLLSCREPMDAYPLAFGAISGQLLPDSHHAGADGGRLNRLLSEIQMLLFQQHSSARHDRGEVDVSGVWMWAPLDMSSQLETDTKSIAVATRNPVLQSIVDGKDAAVIITEVERLSELVQADAVLPKRIVLAGADYAVLLTRSWLPKFGKIKWQAKSVQAETLLYSLLII